MIFLLTNKFFCSATRKFTLTRLKHSTKFLLLEVGHRNALATRLVFSFILSTGSNPQWFMATQRKKVLEKYLLALPMVYQSIKNQK